MAFSLPHSLAPWHRPLRGLIAAVLILGLLATTVWLALDVRNKLAALQRASSDNVLWVVSQSEVELLRLQDSILMAQLASEADRALRLDDVRLRFDVAFSRITLLRESPNYARAAAEGGQQANLQRMQDYLARLVPLIDGDDAALGQALPLLLAETLAIHPAQRALSTGILAALTKSAEDQRTSVARTLERLGLAAGALFVLLLVMLGLLARQTRRGTRQAEELRRTSARLDTVIRTSAEGIIVTDRDGRIIDLNPAAEAMFGRRADEVRGRDAMRSLCPPDVVEAQRHHVLAALPLLGMTGARPLRLELEANRADGSRFPIELSMAGAPDRADAPGDRLVVGFLRDISDRRRTERILSDALDTARAGERAKAQFLAVMSHEMRTPLNGMVGAAELLADTALSPDQARLVDVLQRSGRLLLSHVNAVLDVTAAQSGAIVLNPRPTDLDQLIGDCIANQHASALARGNRIHYRALSGPLGTHPVDPARLGQIVLNLLGNAVKFTRQGQVTVETERLPGMQPALLELRVIDTGPGIAEADLDHIFDEFVTLDGGYGRTEEGSGLGLAVARRLTEAMGGSIGVESEPGAGSVFWVRLPLAGGETAAAAGPAPAGLAPPAPAPDATVPQSETTPGRALSVLVIEDNAVNRFVVKTHLEAAGHQVTEAVDGKEGVALAGAALFDVILTDISMPRMNGIEAAAAIRSGRHGAASAKARIVAVTAHALPEELDSFRRAGIDDWLIKPIDRARLLAVLTPSGAAAARAAEAGPAPAEVPLCDPRRMEDLTTQLGPDMAQRILARFLNEGREGLAEIARLTAAPPQGSAAPDGDRSLAALCHKLAGSAGTFGAARLARHLGRIESGLKSGTLSAADLATLPELWDLTEAAFRDGGTSAD